MCFSAEASFILGGALVPAGAYAIAKTRQAGPEWLPFAIYPLAFGIQQVFEGIVWLAFENGDAATLAWSSRGFLFFSHFFWLAWVPISVWRLEPDPKRKRMASILAVFGFLFGLSLFLPSFLIGEWLRVEVVNRSLDYKTTLVYQDPISRTVLRVIYAIIILSALFISSNRRIRIFALMIAVSVGATYLFFAYAFISVWCFFAAGLSAYLAWVVQQEAQAVSPSAARARG